MPGPPEKPGDDAAHDAYEAQARMSWARLLRRVFDLDLEHCPQCGSELKIIAAIEEPAENQRGQPRIKIETPHAAEEPFLYRITCRGAEICVGNYRSSRE